MIGEQSVQSTSMIKSTTEATRHNPSISNDNGTFRQVEKFISNDMSVMPKEIKTLEMPNTKVMQTNMSTNNDLT